jgi:hypothetical protein
VGCQLGRLGPLTGRRVFCRPDPLVGDDREPGRWRPRGTHVSQIAYCFFEQMLYKHDKLWKHCQSLSVAQVNY